MSSLFHTWQYIHCYLRILSPKQANFIQIIKIFHQSITISIKNITSPINLTLYITKTNKRPFLSLSIVNCCIFSSILPSCLLIKTSFAYLFNGIFHHHTNYNFKMEHSNSKTFKIRKTSRLQRTQDAQDIEEVSNLKDLRLADEITSQDKPAITVKIDESQIVRPKEYLNDEEDINCLRFPHSAFCGCDNNSLLQSFDAYQVSPNLFIGSFASGLKTKSLLQLGVTHILNVTSKEYTKRNKYFEYLNIDLHSGTEEDIKKFYRLTNRFIKGTIVRGGKVFIHTSELQLGAVVAIGYLIGVTKTPMKQSLQLVLKGKLQIAPHFMKQIESYDLQKMAFVSLQRE